MTAPAPQCQPRDADLVERLRDHALQNKQERCAMFEEAAARIEELEGALRDAMTYIADFGDDLHSAPTIRRLRAAANPREPNDPLAKILDADRIGYAEEQRQARTWMDDLSASLKQEPGA